MKRFAGMGIVLLALCALLVLGASSKAKAVQVGGYCGGEGDGTNLTWSLDTKTGVLTISGTGKMADFVNLKSVPWASYKEHITSIVLENGLTTIGNRAFSGCYHTFGTLTLPDSLQSIGDDAFYDCGFTGSLTLPNSLQSIGDSAFCGCDFTGSLTLPDSLQSIEIYAFYRCRFNGTLTIPSSVQRIRRAAFAECSFSDIYVAPDNAYYSAHDLMLFRKEQNEEVELLYCSPAKSGHLTIPDTVEWIEERAFHGCSYLTGSLTLPNSLRTICHGAFEYCSGFNGTLTIPSSVWNIDICAFEGCPFSDIYVAPDNAYYSAHDLMLFEKEQNEESLLYCSPAKSGHLTIPDTVTRIGYHAFSDCSNLTGSLTLPNSLQSIGDSAFYGCSGFTGSLTLPNSLQSIGYCAFYGCSNLTGSLTLPNSLQSIGEWAFYNCSQFTDIFFKGNAPTLGYRAFPDNVTLYYINGKTGWTTPKFNGYKCYPISSSGGIIMSGETGTALRNQYSFRVVNASSGDPVSNAQLTYNGTTAFTKASGYAVVEDFVPEKALTVSASGYGTYSVTAYASKESGQDIIKLNPDPYCIISALMRYNKDRRDLVSERAVINLIYPDTQFTIECTVPELAASSIKGYELRQGERIIASCENGKFTVKVGDFEKDTSVSVSVIDSNGNELSSTPLMLTVKDEKAEIPASLSLGKSIKFTVPSNVPILGGNEIDLKIPLLPMTVDVGEDSIEVGVNFNIAEYKKTLSAGGKDPKIQWLKGFEKTPDLSKQIANTAKQIGTRKMKHRLARGFSWEWTAFGAAEMPYDASYLKGKLYILLEFNASREWQAWVLPPIVAELSFKGKANVGGEFEWTVEDGFAFQIPLTVDAAFDLYAGAGGASLASVGVYGEGGTELKLLIAGSEADSGLESWKLYGSVGLRAMCLRRELINLPLWNEETYLYRRDTGGLQSMPGQTYMSPGQSYMSPGQVFSGLDSDVIYSTIARQQQSRWLGVDALNVKTVVIQPEWLTTVEMMEPTDDPTTPMPEATPNETSLPSPTPEVTPALDSDPTPDPEATVTPMPETTPNETSLPAPTPETTPALDSDSTPDPEATVTPMPEITLETTSAPTPTSEKNASLGARSNMYTAQLSLRNTLPGSSHIAFALPNLTDAPTLPTALQRNADTEIEPLLVECGDTLMMLYCDADMDRPLEDCSKLVFSVLDSATGQWTEPAAVWDDGTADYAPDACAAGNGVYIVWQNANAPLNENDTLNEIGAKLELSVAFFDPTACSFTVETVTNNSIYEALPNICMTEEGMPALVWAENAGNDVLGMSATEQEPNRLYCMQKSIFGWDEKMLLAEYEGIAFSADIGLTGSGIEACVNLDTDNDLDTVEDRAVLMVQPGKSATSISGTDARYLGGALLYLDNTQEESSTLYYNGSAMDTVTLPNAGYTAALDTDGNIMLCWSVTQAGKGCLYMMAYSAAENTWTEPVALTEAEENHYHEKSACAYVAGTPVFVYMDRMVADPEVLDVTAGLYWLTMPEQVAYTINSVLFDETELEPGSVLPLTVEITNMGTVSIDALHAVLADADGETVFEQDITFALPSGCTGTAELMFLLPENIQRMQYTLKLGNEEYTGIDIGRAMLVTGNQVYRVDDEQIVIAYVKNLGLAPASGIFTVIDQENGATVASGNFNDLGYEEAFSLQFSISEMQTDWNLMLIAETDAEQVSTGGNTSYIKLYNESSFVLGDINQDGTIDKLDPLLLSKHLAGMMTLPDNQSVLADMNEDGTLDMRDVLLICSYIVK